MRPEFAASLARAAAGRGLERGDIIPLLGAAAGEEADALYRQADAVRARVAGEEVHLRGIIEFSNYCRRRCYYCGLRADNAKLRRYRLLPEDIVAAARRGAELGYGTVVLQSGEDPWYTAAILADVIRAIKKLGVAVTLCVGERPREEYALWREAGADRYLLKHETANAELYTRLHPGMSWQERLQCLDWLRELGYQVGSGNIIGLPGHPVSAMVVFGILLEPLLRYGNYNHLAGTGTVVATISRTITSTPGREDYIRVRLPAGPQGLLAVPVPGGSSLITSMVQADGLVTIPLEEEGLEAGSQVEVRLF